jgi:hypothetical protein
LAIQQHTHERNGARNKPFPHCHRSFQQALQLDAYCYDAFAALIEVWERHHPMAAAARPHMAG